MLKANPFKVAQELSDEFGLKIRACYDGMSVKI